MININKKQLMTGIVVLGATIVLGQYLIANAATNPTNQIGNREEQQKIVNKGELNKEQQRAEHTEEEHEAIEKAIEENDYNAWKELVGEKGIANKITEENFAKFAEAHRLMEEGKTEEANAIRAELGLGTGRGDKDGHGPKNGTRPDREKCS